MSISLIVPTYRNPKYLDLCLKSATENALLNDTQIIVIVDGFIEESKEVLSKYPEVSILELEENKGMQYALNYGVAQASNEFVFIINDDNVMPRNWDVGLLYCLDKCEKNCVLTVDQVEPVGPGMFNFDVHDLGQTADTFQYDEWLNYEYQIQSSEEKKDGHIFPFVIQKKYYMAVGGFDTFYNSPNICDWDFFLKLELLDFVFPRTKMMHLYHFGSIATKKNAESTIFKQKEQQAFSDYEWKWGAKPTNQSGSNSKLPLDRQFRGFKV